MLQSEWAKDTPGQAQLKVAVLDATYSWWLSPCIKSNDLFFPKILMIKEFCNLILKDAKLGQIKPKVIVSNATSPGGQSPYKNRLIPFREIDDQRTLQSDWMKVATLNQKL